MALSKYQRLAYRVFGAAVADSARENTHLRITLQRAHINVRPEVYLAYYYMNMALGFGVTLLVVALLVIARAAGLLAVPGTAFVILIPLPAILAATIYLTTFILPDLKAGSRARDIEAKLPYALNYISIMASAGITVDKVFESLSRQPVYGEISAEAAWIGRDINLLGKDVIGALNLAIDRSPSLKFQDFLQGTIITMTSGGDLKNYFRAKSDQFAYENRQDSKRFLDNLGIIAESYVTVVVAAPLFVLILLSVMTMFGGSSDETLRTGYLMILGVLPLAQVGFGFTIKALNVEP